MMKINELLKLLAFPSEIILPLQATPHGLNNEQFDYFSNKMRKPSEYENNANELAKALEPDPKGHKMLNTLLEIACKTHNDYKEKGVCDDIFIQTMKCLLRFTLEHKESYGEYGFNRAFWVGRQLSMKLFRIGELEYEMVELEGKNAISIHIPSDANLTDEKVDFSLLKAKEFFATYYPTYHGVTYFCSSWLLSPVLKNMLPPTSKILKFANRFTVAKYDESAEDYKIWVYKSNQLKPEDFPENTSLQRNLKKHVLSGGKVGEAFGVLI